MKRQISLILSAATAISMLASCSGGKSQDGGEPNEPKNLWTSYWENDDAYGMSVKDGTLLLNGSPYYGFGFNYYSLFSYSYSGTNNLFNLETSKAGLDKMAENDVQIVRFNCGGYGKINPTDKTSYDWVERYLTDKEAYLSALTEIVDYAESKKIGLIPSLFWVTSSVPAHFEERTSALGSPDSESYKFIEKYTADIVTALKDSKAVMGWELGNEWNLQLELAPHDYAKYGEWTWMSLNEYNTVLKLFKNTVNSIDEHNRFIACGNAELRRCQYNQYKLYAEPAIGTDYSPLNNFEAYVNWLKTTAKADLSVNIDTWEEHLEWQKLSHPDGVDMISEHVYDWPGVRPYKKTLKEYVSSTVNYAKALNKCYYLGEFNLSMSDTWHVYDGEKETEEISDYQWVSEHIEDACNTLIESRVQLVLFWNYDPTDNTEGSFCTENVQGTAAGKKHAAYGNRLFTLAKKLNEESYPAALSNSAESGN